MSLLATTSTASCPVDFLVSVTLTVSPIVALTVACSTSIWPSISYWSVESKASVRVISDPLEFISVTSTTSKLPCSLLSTSIGNGI